MSTCTSYLHLNLNNIQGSYFKSLFYIALVLHLVYINICRQRLILSVHGFKSQFSLVLMPLVHNILVLQYYNIISEFLSLQMRKLSNSSLMLYFSNLTLIWVFKTPFYGYNVVIELYTYFVYKLFFKIVILAGCLNIMFPKRNIINCNWH